MEMPIDSSRTLQASILPGAVVPFRPPPGRQRAGAIGLSISETAFIAQFLHRQHALTIWLAFRQLAFGTARSPSDPVPSPV